MRFAPRPPPASHPIVYMYICICIQIFDTLIYICAYIYARGVVVAICMGPSGPLVGVVAMLVSSKVYLVALILLLVVLPRQRERERERERLAASKLFF